MRGLPGELDLAAVEQACDQAADLADIELGSGRTGRAERDAQECSRDSACVALDVTSRIASARIEASRSSSITSSPLTTAPRGPTRSWHTRLTRNAANSMSSMEVAVSGEKHGEQVVTVGLAS